MKVRLPALNLFYYPDLAVTCDGRDRIWDQDFILHPKLIVEVLSDSLPASAFPVQWKLSTKMSHNYCDF